MGVRGQATWHHVSPTGFLERNDLGQLAEVLAHKRRTQGTPHAVHLVDPFPDSIAYPGWVGIPRRAIVDSHDDEQLEQVAVLYAVDIDIDARVGFAKSVHAASFDAQQRPQYRLWLVVPWCVP